VPQPPPEPERRNPFTDLYDLAEAKGMRVLLPLYGPAHGSVMRVEVYKDGILSDYEHVKFRQDDSPEDAAVRMLARRDYNGL